MPRFSDAETTTLEKGFWFLKRGLWQRQGVGDGSPASLGGTFLTGNIPETEGKVSSHLQGA